MTFSVVSLCLLAICFQSTLVALFINDKNDLAALQSIISDKKKKEALCILSSQTYFAHFPHTSEQLFPCWEFFQEHADLQCAFQLPHKQYFAEGWVQDVVYAMNCHIYPYRDHSQYKDFQNVDSVFQATPREEYQNKTEFPRFQKSSNGYHLADTITKHFGRELPEVTTTTFEQTNDKNKDNTNTTARPISIGIIQRDQRRARGANRVILNLDDILDNLRQVFPPDQVLFYQADPMDLDTAQQVRFFYKHDIVMAVMGAACTNVAFMRPGSVFFEIYTPGYYDPMYMQIALSVGVQYLNYTATEPEVIRPKKTIQQLKIRNKPTLDVDLTLNATVVVDRLQRAAEMFQQRNTQPLSLEG